MEMIIIFLLQSLFFLGLGLIIYTQKAADLLNFFNPKKHNKEKASQRFGRLFILLGLTNLFMTILIFFKPHYSITYMSRSLLYYLSD